MITLEDITKKAKLLAEEAKEEVSSKCDGRSLDDFCSYIEKYSIKIGEWIMEETQKDSNTLIGKVDNNGEIEFHHIPFDIEKAKNGADVITKKGHKATIFDYNFKEKCTGRILIAGKIKEGLGDTLIFWDQKGKMADTKVRFFDLVIIEEIKYEYRWMVVSLMTGYTSQLFANKEEADHERIRRSEFSQDYQIVKLRVRV